MMLYEVRSTTQDSNQQLLELIIKHSKRTLMILSRVFVFLLVQLISTFFNPTVAQDIYDLARSNDVEVVAWLGSDPEVEKPMVSVNEQLVLYVEVATPRWFTSGTRIGMIEIPNVITKQRNTLATNYAERKDGQTWSRQRWEITLYPTASGEFVVPPVAVSVEVSAPNREKVAGTLYTAPMTFEAKMPSGTLTEDSAWFTANEVSVTQNWSTSNDDLKVGDAIHRTVIIEAQDSLSILLPKLLSGKSTDDYQAYLQPRQLDDTQVRGDYRSTNLEEGVYVVQQGGKVEFPDVTFEWWNAKEKKLEQVTIKGESFSVSHTPMSFVEAYQTTILVTLCVLVVFLGVSFFARREIKTRLANNTMPLIVQLLNFMYKKQWGAARTLLYKQLRLNTTKLEMNKLSSTQSWQEDGRALQQGKRDVSLFIRMRNAIKRANIGKRGRLLMLPKALPQLDSRNSAKRTTKTN